MKVILDTNLFISTFIFGSFVQKIFDMVIKDKIELCISEELYDEIEEKFRDFDCENTFLNKIKPILENKALMFVPEITLEVCRDEKDNFLLELAQTAEADFLITRDKDLLSLEGQKWRGTQIIIPQDFLQKIDVI